MSAERSRGGDFSERYSQLAVKATVEGGHATPNIESLIRISAEAGILEMHEQRWRFSHDRLRDHILRGLRQTERCELHEQVARSLESTYQGSALPVAQLAYHYDHAQHPDQAARYYVQAGLSALSRGTPLEAATMLAKAQTLPAAGHRTQDLLRLTAVAMGRDHQAAGDHIRCLAAEILAH